MAEKMDRDFLYGLDMVTKYGDSQGAVQRVEGTVTVEGIVRPGNRSKLGRTAAGTPRSVGDRMCANFRRLCSLSSVKGALGGEDEWANGKHRVGDLRLDCIRLMTRL
jgi:hypothetical protein